MSEALLPAVERLDAMPAVELGPALTAHLSAGRVVVVSYGPSSEPVEVLGALEPDLGPLLSHKHSDGSGIVTIRAGASDGVRRPQNWPGTQSPHNDGCFLEQPPQVLALYCSSPPGEGGESTFVSGKALLNALITRFHPAEIAPLFRSSAYSIRRGDTVLSRAVFVETQGPGGPSVGCYFSAHEFNRVVPSISALPAFDFLREFVRYPANQIAVKLDAGDCVFVPNTTVLHGRMRWIDQPGQARVIHRAWLGGRAPSGFRSDHPKQMDAIRAVLTDTTPKGFHHVYR